MNNSDGMKRKKLNRGTLGRLFRFLLRAYPVLMPLTALCIVFSAVVSSIPALFQQRVLAVVREFFESGNTDWSAAAVRIVPLVTALAGLYVASILLITLYTQLMAVITQGFLNKLRRTILKLYGHKK